MTDIVERLRQGIGAAEHIPECEDIMDKAADEIERLRQEVEKLRGTLSFYGDHLSYGRGLVRFEGTRPDVMKDNGGLARRVLQQTADRR
jgi:hypothetical protein